MTLAEYEKDPNHITTAFIKYYYTKLSSDCSKLYQLYTEDAVVKHMESKPDPFKSKFDEHTGNPRIKKYWKSHPSLANAKFVILTLSITQNSDQSLVITIVGELLLREDYDDDLNITNEILPTRTFNQVFILEPHPTKDNYLIKSDILTFIPDSEYISDESNALNVELVNDVCENISKLDSEVQQEVVENFAKSSKRPTNDVKESRKTSSYVSNNKSNNTPSASASNTISQTQTHAQTQNLISTQTPTPTPTPTPTTAPSSVTTTATTTKSKSKLSLPISPKNSVSPNKTEIPISSSTPASTSVPVAPIPTQPSKSKANSPPATNNSQTSSSASPPASKSPSTSTLPPTPSTTPSPIPASQLKQQESSDKTVKPSASTSDIPTSDVLTTATSYTTKSSNTPVQLSSLKPAPSTPKPSGSWANALKPTGTSNPNTIIVVPPASTSLSNVTSTRLKSIPLAKSSQQSQSSTKLSTENNKFEITNKNSNTDSAPLNSNKSGSLPDALYEVFVIYKNAEKDVSESDLSVLFTKNNCYEFKIISMNSRNAVVGFYDEQVQKKFLNKKTLSNNDLTINIDVRNNYNNYRKKNYNNGYKKNNNHNSNNNNDRKK